jgi:membrane-associated phospholipid phosphatase
MTTLLTAVVCPFAVRFDLELTRWIVSGSFPGDFQKAIELSEVFAHGIGVIIILWLMGALAPYSRWALPRLVIMSFGGGAIATLAKLIIIRERPYHFDLQNAPLSVGYEFMWDWRLENLAVYDAAWRSFPSGHAATALGLAIGLGMVFPRGRFLFLIIGMLSMVQRVAEQAHFPSDVLAGTAIGAIWSFVCIHPHLLGAIFTQIEPPVPEDVSTKTSESNGDDQAKPLDEVPRRIAA